MFELEKRKSKKLVCFQNSLEWKNQSPQHNQRRQKQPSASRGMCLPKSENRPTIFESIPGCKPRLNDSSEKKYLKISKLKLAYLYYFYFFTK